MTYEFVKVDVKYLKFLFCERDLFLRNCVKCRFVTVLKSPADSLEYIYKVIFVTLIWLCYYGPFYCSEFEDFKF